jgi:hypothetical protein
MPTFEFTSPEGKSYTVDGPEGATPDQAFQILQQHLAGPQESGSPVTAGGLAKAAGTGAVQGLGSPGDLREAGIGLLPESLQGIARSVLKGPLTFGIGNLPTSQQTQGAAESVLGQPLHQVGNMPERIAQGAAQSLTNPLSYVGPGGLALKAGGAAMSGAGGAVGKETGLPGGELAGSLIGGVAAAKGLTPRAAEAAIPTAAEQKIDYKASYKRAAESDLKVTPQSVATVAENAKQELFREGFDPEEKTFKLLDTAQRAPEAVSSQTLDVIGKRLGRYARETQMGNAGPEPTANAAAATMALAHFREFGANVPESAVVAGSAKAYSDAVGRANKGVAAYKQTRDAELRTERAVNNYEGGIDVRLDKQLKSQFRPVLNNPVKQRGLNADQIAAHKDLNRGDAGNALLAQAGRFSGLTPVGLALNLHALGPAGLVTGLLAHGARKLSQDRSLGQANRIRDLAAMRSPLYQDRLGALAPPLPGTSPQQAQLLRSAILGMQ